MTTVQPSATPAKQTKRRAVVLIAVLVVVVILSLAGYHYCDMMTQEYKASAGAHKVVQARAMADSGVYFAAMMLANPDNYYGSLGGNPWNNSMFSSTVDGDNGLVGRFTLIAPPDPEDGGSEPRIGVSDESGKINLNALMKLDNTGQLAFDVLMKLPNMTEGIANAIVDWMDPDSDERTDGAEDSYYTGLGYRCKNGPIDSIDELRLVKGVDAGLLYGSDTNRNGFQDANEGGNDGFSRGWSAYLTVHSREQNYDAEGNLFVNLNNKDLNLMLTAVNEQLGDYPELVKFLVMYRQYGPYSATGGTQSLGGAIASLLTGGSASSATETEQGSLESFKLATKEDGTLSKAAKYTLPSIFELIDAKIGISRKVTMGKTTKTIITIYECPLIDASMRAEVLPKLLSLFSLVEDQEIPARINVNTAPREVLMAIPDLTEADVETIISTRPRLSSTEATGEAFQTAAWLATEAQLPSATLKKIEKYITGRTQVYRVQSIGSFEGKGPSIRVEAIIDTNGGRPRILAWRDLSELGKGMNEKTP